ncbi:MAG: hypothetical protein ACRC5T_09090 [Cetobacterium sp.]
MAKIADDKYYTPNAVVKKVIELIEKDLMPLEQFSRIIEPSAGAGAFLRELPKSAIGYDILPEFEGIKKGDYLQQEIPRLENSLVIGNPPFGAMGGLTKSFIKRSFDHSDYVVFVIPVDNYNKQPRIKGVVLYKSYKLPEVKYSGVSLKCCVNIYKRGVVEEKRIKAVHVKGFSKVKGGSNVVEWEKVPYDFRICSFGALRVLKKTMKTYCGEIKIKFEKEKNFEPILKKYLEKKTNESISVGSVTRQEIINLIYDNYEDLRED